MTKPAGARAEPFFMAGSAGQLFAIHHRPSAGDATEAVLFVPPFAEEMNKSRRMFTLVAHELGALGYASLLVDLFGTGDSAGDFADARWSIWLDDLRRALEHLRRTGVATVHVVALRLGALLAADLAADAPGALGRLTFWQPVTSGEAFLTQFLRLRMAASLMDAGQQKESTDDLRKLLAAGQPIEIGGYLLAPELAEAIGSRSLAQAPLAHGTRVDWIDVVADASRGLSPASKRCIETIRGRGVEVTASAVVGEPFWSAIEIAAPPTLIEATAACFRRETRHD